MEIEKTCNKCKEKKCLDLFYKQKNGKLGKTAECKDCRIKRSLAYIKHNKAKVRDTTRKNYDPDRKKVLNKEWREKNKGYFKEYREKQKLFFMTGEDKVNPLYIGKG